MNTDKIARAIAKEVLTLAEDESCCFDVGQLLQFCLEDIKEMAENYIENGQV